MKDSNEWRFRSIEQTLIAIERRTRLRNNSAMYITYGLIRTEQTLLVTVDTITKESSRLRLLYAIWTHK